MPPTILPPIEYGVYSRRSRCVFVRAMQSVSDGLPTMMSRTSSRRQRRRPRRRSQCDGVLLGPRRAVNDTGFPSATRNGPYAPPRGRLSTPRDGGPVRPSVQDVRTPMGRTAGRERGRRRRRRTAERRHPAEMTDGGRRCLTTCPRARRPGRGERGRALTTRTPARIDRPGGRTTAAPEDGTERNGDSR